MAKFYEEPEVEIRRYRISADRIFTESDPENGGGGLGDDDIVDDDDPFAD